jgi:hypothetical protein
MSKEVPDMSTETHVINVVIAVLLVATLVVLAIALVT